MNSILSEVDGWTPVIDALTQELGLITSAVYGVVWRYCQMDDHVCRASLETMGDKLGLDKATVQRHLKVLCDAGYLEDTTPGLRNRPHTYIDTGRAKIVMLISARCTGQSDVAENNATLQSTTPRCTEHVEETSKILERDNQDNTRVGATPTSFQGWLKYIRNTSNRAAALRRMFITLYPDSPAPDFSYIAKVAKKVGAARLAQLLWENSTRPPVGDVLAYVSAIKKNQEQNKEPKGYSALTKFVEGLDGEPEGGG